MTNPCVITGCCLFDPANARHAHGDLFRIGDCWVFNAVLTPASEVLWKPIATDRKMLVVSSRTPPGGLLERRGVIVIHHDWAELNKAALEYIGA